MILLKSSMKDVAKIPSLSRMTFLSFPLMVRHWALNLNDAIIYFFHTIFGTQPRGKVAKRVNRTWNLTKVNPLPPSDAVQKHKKNILEDLFSSILQQFKKYHPSGNLNFNNKGIFQSLKFRIWMETILRIFRKLNFTPNTSGCYRLTNTMVCH